MSRKIFTTMLLVGVLALGVFTVAAQDDHILVPTDSGLKLIIADGRLNGLDIAAPVAVYNTFTPSFDTNGIPVQEPFGIRLLAIDPVTSNGVPLFDLTTDEVLQLMNSEDHMLVQDGYTLNYSPDTNWFWVAAPPDAEGKVYTFQWENLYFPVGQLPSTTTLDDTAASDDATTTTDTDMTSDMTDDTTDMTDDTPATPTP
jgi:hypothetical protein